MRAARRASRPASALVVAVACSNTADGMTRLGIPLLVLAHGGSASTIAWVVASGVAPWLVLALPAGAVLDRGRPDRWARFAHGARAALLVAAAVALGGPAPHPSVAAWMVLAWALGCAEVVADLAAQTLVQRTIDDHGLAGLNARVSAAQLSANQFVGPIVGGVAVAAIGPGALVVAAAAYGFAALTIPAGSLPGTDPANPAAEPAECTGLGDALRYLRARRDLASLAAAVGVLNAVNEATMAVLPALALGAPLR
jgi:hypothetical protein